MTPADRLTQLEAALARYTAAGHGDSPAAHETRDMIAAYRALQAEET